MSFVYLQISQDPHNNFTLFNINQPPTQLTVIYLITIPDCCLQGYRNSKLCIHKS